MVYQNTRVPWFVDNKQLLTNIFQNYIKNYNMCPGLFIITFIYLLFSQNLKTNLEHYIYYLQLSRCIYIV